MPGGVRERGVLAVVLLVAAGLRLAACIVWSDDLRRDPDAYAALASRIIETGGGFVRGDGSPTAFRPPLYPYLLAGVRWAGPDAIAFLQIVLGTATVGLTALLGRRLGLGAWSLLAALLVAVDPLLLRYTPQVMTETLCTFLAVLVLWLAADGRRPLLLGVAFGLAALSRPTFWAFGMLAAAWWMVGVFRHRSPSPQRRGGAGGDVVALPEALPTPSRRFPSPSGEGSGVRGGLVVASSESPSERASSDEAVGPSRPVAPLTPGPSPQRRGETGDDVDAHPEDLPAPGRRFPSSAGEGAGARGGLAGASSELSSGTRSPAGIFTKAMASPGRQPASQAISGDPEADASGSPVVTDHRAFLRNAMFVVLGVAVVTLPWVVRNVVAFGRPVLTTTHGGYTLLLANNPVFWKEVLFGPPGARWDGESLDRWQRSLEVELREAGIAPDDELTRDRWMKQRAQDYIRQRPDLFVRSAAYRFQRLWEVVPPGAATIPAGIRWSVGVFSVAVFVLATAGLCRLIAMNGWNVLTIGSPLLWGERPEVREVQRQSSAIATTTREAGKEPTNSRDERQTNPLTPGPSPEGEGGRRTAASWWPALWLVVAFTTVHAVYWTDTRMRAPLVPVVALLAAGALTGVNRRVARRQKPQET